MADKKISELTAATSIGTTDLFVLQQANIAKKLTGQILINWLTAAADGHGGIQSIAYSPAVPPSLQASMVVTLADGTVTAIPVYNGAKGDKGDQTYVHIKYASTQPTSDADIGNTPDAWMGIYVGTSAQAPTSYLSYAWNNIKGAKGDIGDPIEITSAVVSYGTSSSGTALPSTWQSSIPTVQPGYYLWSRTVVTYSDDTSTTTYGISRQGIDGSGSVSSVNYIPPDASGNIILTAEDVGALPDDTPLPVASDTPPQMDGSASAGVSSDVSRSDHVHPRDTSKANADMSNVSSINGSKITNSSITDAKLAANAVSTIYTATVPHATSAWTEQGGQYFTIISVPGLLLSDTPDIGVNPDMSDPLTASQVVDEWDSLRKFGYVYAANTLVLIFRGIPTVDIPIQIRCIRK